MDVEVDRTGTHTTSVEVVASGFAVQTPASVLQSTVRTMSRFRCTRGQGAAARAEAAHQYITFRYTRDGSEYSRSALRSLGQTDCGVREGYSEVGNGRRARQCASLR